LDNNLIETYIQDDGSDQDFINVLGFMEVFQNKLKIRKLLFGRKDVRSKSIFEEILSKCVLIDGKWNEDYAKLLSYIWHEFRLWEVPEIYTMVGFKLIFIFTLYYNICTLPPSTLSSLIFKFEELFQIKLINLINFRKIPYIKH